MEKFDFAIIGGGIFGIYAALYLHKAGYRICLIEKEAQLLKKASIVNQARLHSGYHYPRSVATAVMSNENKERFTADHHSFINFAFDQYYAIDKYGSFTDASQFHRFCSYLDIVCEETKGHPLFNNDRIEAVFKTVEYSFDPILLADYYRHQLAENPDIVIFNEAVLLNTIADSDAWVIEFLRHSNQENRRIEATQVINATYAGSNAVNRLFQVPEIDLMHEISEMAFVTSPQFDNLGLTIMDGPFASLMPYGLSGLLSLSSVAYTHHKVSYDNLPGFDCQLENRLCTPNGLSICNECAAKPKSNYRKMLAQIQQYFSPKVNFQYFTSYYTVKSKLKASFVDDGRPTEIAMLRENPRFYCIFAGKINSIYEIEKVITF